MAVTIHLPIEAEEALERKAQAEGVSKESYAQKVIERDLGLSDVRPSNGLERSSSESATPLLSVANMILDRVRALPPEAFEGLPEDGASQHDHYIYGTPKRDDL